MGVCGGGDVKSREGPIHVHAVMYAQRQDRQKERGNLVFFTERKTEKLDIFCHRDTKMLLINNCIRMKQQQITNGGKKWMDTQEEGLFCLL